MYTTAGNFEGFDFCWWAIFLDFAFNFFMDVCDHANTCMYKRAYFVSLNYAVSPGSMTTADINTFENFPIYSNTYMYVHGRANHI